MTDEEMAEEYAHNHVHYEVAKRENGADYAKEVSSVTIKQAYSDGLKAGRKTQWHRVADGDLPKIGHEVLNEDSDKVRYENTGYSGWIAYSGHEERDVEIDAPIAWCEEPQYTEE